MAPALPTPETAPLHPTVYPPSEDTYLLLDSFAADVAWLTQHLAATPAPLILELGPGSGMLSSFLYANAPVLLGPDVVPHFLAVDANPHACETTLGTLALAPAPASRPVVLDAVTGDLATALRPGLVDVLIFNPPYVPSSDLPELTGKEGEGSWDKESRLLALTYEGGQEGMEVTKRVLDDLGRVLARTGVAYVLFCAQNKPEEVVAGLEAEGWRGVRVAESGKKAGWEKLSVWRIWRAGEA